MKSINNDSLFHEVVNRVHREFIAMSYQKFIPRNIVCTTKEKIAIDDKICSLLEREIVEKASHCPGEFTPPFFIRIRNMVPSEYFRNDQN